jgi:glycosyltransferase involved in cell wall biosynthesis
MEKPVVSIIIPCYNQEQYLEECLQSVLAQTFREWECIIVNDGSKDKTEQTAKKWTEKDARFVYVYKENGGLSSARNSGLHSAKGDYIQFLDCDDVLDKDKLQLSLNELNKVNDDQVKVVISNFRMFIDNPDNSLPAYCVLNPAQFNFESLLYDWGDSFTIPIHCGLFDASLFTNFTFQEDIKSKEDWVMWVSIFNDKVKAIFIDKPLAFYRRNPSSMTMQKDMLPDFIRACEYLKRFLTNEEYQKLLMTLFVRYYKSSVYFKVKLNSTIHSNPYVLGNLTKKTLKKTGVLHPFRKLFILLFQKKS